MDAVERISDVYDEIFQEVGTNWRKVAKLPGASRLVFDVVSARCEIDIDGFQHSSNRACPGTSSFS